MTTATPPPLPPRQRPTQPPLPPRPPGPENIHSDSNLSIPLPSGSKRRLLLIYVHGFNGSEASFQQFPAHVHSVLADVLAESHELYTRIYPRYKSRGDMNVARDQFSSWLSPHEAPDLDIILLGHSLGGILTAEVALLPSSSSSSTSPDSDPEARKHNILGLINYDVPFLGLHPGIIQTSAKSLFRRDQTPAEFDQAFSETQAAAEAISFPSFPSENYDPPFFNDVRVPERKGLQGAMHFVEKNYSRLTRSIVSRMVSPYQFAGCLNKYPELRRRYKLLMELEGAHDQARRVRFMNYYTDSEEPVVVKESDSGTEDKDESHASAVVPDTKDTGETEDAHEKSETEEIKKTEAEKTEDTNEKTEDTNEKTETEEIEKTETETETEENTKDASTHENADSLAKENTPTPPHPETQEAHEAEEIHPDAKETDTDTNQHKRRKFILLPSHHWRGYGDDSLWVPVNMDNMNEILAHQSIFIPQGQNYDRLVGDTVATIERWVQDALTVQALDAVRCEEGK